MTVSQGFSIVHDTTSQPRLRTAKRALVGFLLMAALTAAVWFNRAPLLRGAAELWIVSDPVGPADAIVILGGGLETRPFAAAEYYQQGLSKKILISNVDAGQSTALGVLPSHTDSNRMVLVKLGVPETAIELFGKSLSNTHEEAVALREWAERTHVHTLIVPTEDFSSRRLRWVLGRVFDGTPVSVTVPALRPTDYNDREWWRSDQGLINFQNEVIKYIFYRFKY